MAKKIFAFDLEITKGRFRLLTFDEAKVLKVKLDLEIAEYERNLKTEKSLHEFEKSNQQYPDELFIPKSKK